MFSFQWRHGSLFPLCLKRELAFRVYTSSNTHWRLLALIANVLFFPMRILSCFFSQSNHYGRLWLSGHRVFVFNVKSGLHSDVVSVKFSSGSAVQRCCFLLQRCTGIYAETRPQWVSSCPRPLPLSSFSLSLGHSVGVAAFNVCVKQSLNLDIKLLFRKKWFQKKRIKL